MPFSDFKSFLPFNIARIHAALTILSFVNLTKEYLTNDKRISRSTLAHCFQLDIWKKIFKIFRIFQKTSNAKEVAGLFIPPNTFLQKLDVCGSKTFKKSIVLKL